MTEITYVGLRIEPEMKRLLKQHAELSGCNLSELLRNYIEQSFETERKEDVAAIEMIRQEVGPEAIAAIKGLHVRPSVYWERWWAAHQGEEQCGA